MALPSPRRAFVHRPGVPVDWEPNHREHRRMIALSVNDILRGKLNNTGRVTLSENSATTTVINPLVEANSCVLMTPLSATAASENWWLSNVVPRQSFTLTHASAPSTDRTFCYAILS